MGERIQLKAVDGFTFVAYRAMPGNRPRGGVVVIQEIFGVNSHILPVTDGFADAGYRTAGFVSNPFLDGELGIGR